jgi:hypothetical protein
VELYYYFSDDFAGIMLGIGKGIGKDRLISPVGAKILPKPSTFLAG